MRLQARANGLRPWSRWRSESGDAFTAPNHLLIGCGILDPRGRKMGFAKRIFRRLPMAVKSPAVRAMKLIQTQTAVGKFYSRAAAMNIVELSVRGDYGVFTQSAA